MQKTLNEIQAADEKLLAETQAAAEKLFAAFKVRVWYLKAGDLWRCIVINTNNKVKLVKGTLKRTPDAAVRQVKTQLENIVGKTKTS